MPRLLFGFLVLFLVFVPLERLFALRKQKLFRRGFFTDLVHFFVNHFLIQLGLFVVLGLLVAILDRFVVSASFQASVAAQPAWLQFIEALLLAGLGGYAGHRLNHQLPWLWRFHAVHHSIDEMDWLASARLHPIDQIVTRSLAIVPLYLMGFTKETFGAYLGLSVLWALFIHSNVRFRFRWLRYLIATPAFHHWHHSADPEARDKNFAGMLPLFDLLFGSYYLPGSSWPKRYGTDHPVPGGYLKQMLSPFRAG